MIQRLGAYCEKCLRSKDETILQLHHKQYIQCRKAWEYDSHEFEVLCKSCHAIEHGLIRPNSDWILIYSTDLGDLTGTCDLCGTNFGHQYHLVHPNWSEELHTGEQCCNKLTGTCETTELEHWRQQFKRFLKKWSHLSTGKIQFNLSRKFQHLIKIEQIENMTYRINFYVDDILIRQGKESFESVDIAKRKFFEFFNNKEDRKKD